MALVDAIFFNIAMRLYCLRIVIVASVVGVLTMIRAFYSFPVLLVFTLIAVHHLIRWANPLINPRKWSIKVIQRFCPQILFRNHRPCLGASGDRRYVYSPICLAECCAVIDKFSGSNRVFYGDFAGLLWPSIWARNLRSSHRSELDNFWRIVGLVDLSDCDGFALPKEFVERLWHLFLYTGVTGKLHKARKLIR